MACEENVDEHLFAGLQALVDTAFPKHCSNCGRAYETADDYARATHSIFGKTGFKATIDDDGSRVVELFRNCECGSTLLDSFRDRRDTSEAGQRRREKFGALISRLEEKGVPKEAARQELLKLVRGGNSALIEKVVGCKVGR